MGEETSGIKSIEGKREKTSLNLLTYHLDSLSKLANERKVTMTAIMDEATADVLAKYRNTADIDRMLQETSNYLFERDISRVKDMLGDKAEKFSAYQIIHLWNKLKDTVDRTRTFEALLLIDALKALEEANRILENASIVRDSQFKGYNEFRIGNDLKAVQTPLQIEYISSKIGAVAFAKLQTQRPNIFPKPTALTDEKEQANVKIDEAELAEKPDCELTEAESNALFA